jgi:hypothetical protein
LTQSCGILPNGFSYNVSFNYFLTRLLHGDAGTRRNVFDHARSLSGRVGGSESDDLSGMGSVQGRLTNEKTAITRGDEAFIDGACRAGDEFTRPGTMWFGGTSGLNVGILWIYSSSSINFLGHPPHSVFA